MLISTHQLHSLTLSNRHSSAVIRNRIYSIAKTSGSWINRCASASSSKVKSSSVAKIKDSINSETESNRNSAGIKDAINEAGIEISADMRCSTKTMIVLENSLANAAAGNLVHIGTSATRGL